MDPTTITTIALASSTVGATTVALIHAHRIHARLLEANRTLLDAVLAQKNPLAAQLVTQADLQRRATALAEHGSNGEGERYEDEEIS